MLTHIRTTKSILCEVNIHGMLQSLHQSLMKETETFSETWDVPNPILTPLTAQEDLHIITMKASSH
jgi:hypothetical protein